MCFNPTLVIKLSYKPEVKGSPAEPDYSKVKVVIFHRKVEDLDIFSGALSGRQLICNEIQLFSSVCCDMGE